MQMCDNTPFGLKATLFPYSMDYKAPTVCFFVPAEHFSPEKTLSSRTANNTNPSLSIHVSCYHETRLSWFCITNVWLSRRLLTSQSIRPWSALLTSNNGTNLEQVQVDFYSPVLKHEDGENERMSLRLFYASWDVEWYKLQFYTFLVMAFLKDLSIAYFSLWLLC